jgi:MYXO-CTERM domain-containing protein
MMMVSTSGITGPYKVQGNSVFPQAYDGSNEDPVLWYSGGKYHIVFNFFNVRKMLHLESTDGINNWTNMGLAADPTTNMVRYTDGTVNHWNKMERPGVLIENGHVTHFTFAVIDVDKAQDLGNDSHGSKVIVVPFDGVSFDNGSPPGSSGGTDGGAGGTGGVSGSGGAPGTGGKTGTGGTTAAGGKIGTGGATTSDGGTGTGGITGGGAATAFAGAPETGGAIGSGGATATATGGTAKIGGSTATSGGETGGSTNAGGTVATAGAVANGGSVTTGGTIAVGGSAGSVGVSGTGLGGAAGGGVATGGTSAPPAGGTTTATGSPQTSSGCSCRIADGQTRSYPTFALLALLMLGIRPRKRR